MRRRLSSRLTFFYKVVFPTIWLGGFSVGTIASLTRGVGFAVPFAIATLLGLLLFWRTCFPLKKIEAGDDCFWVSAHSEELSIPYSDIEQVYENKLLNLHLVTIVLRQPSRFGRNIVYMPHLQLAFWQDHPTAEYLRKRAGLR